MIGIALGILMMIIGGGAFEFYSHGLAPTDEVPHLWPFVLFVAGMFVAFCSTGSAEER